MFRYLQNKETGIGILEIDGVVITNLISITMYAETNAYNQKFPSLVVERFNDGKLETIRLDRGVITSEKSAIDDLDGIR